MLESHSGISSIFVELSGKAAKYQHLNLHVFQKPAGVTLLVWCTKIKDLSSHLVRHFLKSSLLSSLASNLVKCLLQGFCGIIKRQF